MRQIVLLSLTLGKETLTEGREPIITTEKKRGLLDLFPLKFTQCK
jgi:hypothetical protein